MSFGTYETIELTIEGKLAILTLKRPKVMNALSVTMLEELNSALDTVANSESIRALLITGDGKGFCAGADLGEGSLSFDPTTRASHGTNTQKNMELLFNPIGNKIYNMEKPVIAAVNGAAAGAGMSIALSCDLVFAGESAYFVQVFIPQLGIIPDVGSTWLLPRLIGNARARGAMLLGEKIDAKRAENWGMIYQSVADDQLLETAKKVAGRLANGATFGIAKLKYALNEAESNSFEQQLQLEAEIQNDCCGSSDYVEGVAAFMSKRRPTFTGEQHADGARYPELPSKEQ